ncbi:hypothetical protein ONR57_14070 [Hoyosella sp. YIM 151337]|uniref:hypothetical protein n=1 Tax=Hoyosella sp. YIM 151337 TaxID=2992742 RepID=UPI002236B600|nr:hypothetical protein [Hoyosella sp. YIM 151337]MCW4354431.1 hypothetical protein [Hoyosella sp. YIM 151337]
MLLSILEALVGDLDDWEALGTLSSSTGDLLSGLGDYNVGQAALLEVLQGTYDLNQEWNDELGMWENVDQQYYQPIFPWDPAKRPGGPGNDPLADLLAQLMPPA